MAIAVQEVRLCLSVAAARVTHATTCRRYNATRLTKKGTVTQYFGGPLARNSSQGMTGVKTAPLYTVLLFRGYSVGAVADFVQCIFEVNPANHRAYVLGNGG